MLIDTDFILKSIEDASHQHYRDGSDSADRLAWQVGALSSKIRELAALLDYHSQQVEQLTEELVRLQKELS